MLKIEELKMKCDKCGKEKIYKNVEILDSKYATFGIEIYDMTEENYEGYCDCEMED
jgi:hypothetical protein